jgi:uncharacterized protein YoxC
MEWKQLPWKAWKQVFLSHVHKALLIGIACLGFVVLQWLGEQKTLSDRSREEQWKVTPAVEEVVRDAVTQASLVQASASMGSTVKGVNDPKTVKSAVESSLCPRNLGASRLFGSREQLISAMQEQAEVCVWEKFRTIVEVTSTKLAEVGKRPPASSKEFIGFAEFIAKEEAFSGITARVIRQHVGARLMSQPMKAEDPPNLEQDSDPPWEKMVARFSGKIQKAAAEDSGTHVFFEMLWYASLLLGVVASSILFVIVLTALPITNGKGYWTERIDEILKHVPSPSKSVIAVPLMAALGGGMLAGTITATQPGGESRDVREVQEGREAYEHTRIVSAVPKTPSPPISQSEPIGGETVDRRTYRGGNVYNFGSMADSAVPTPIVDWEPIAGYLGRIDESSRQVAEATGGAKQLLDREFLSVTSWIDEMRIDEIRSAVGATSRSTAQLREAVTKIQEDLGRREDAMQPLIKAVQDLTATMTQHEKEIADAAQIIKEIEDRRASDSTKSLAQTVESDPRPNFFHRTFGPTLYHVGPWVPNLMAARLEGTTDAKVKDMMVEVLQEMRREQPLSHSNFEAKLRQKLLRKLVPEQAEALIQDRSLQKACALPRQ